MRLGLQTGVRAVLRSPVDPLTRNNMTRQEAQAAGSRAVETLKRIPVLWVAVGALGGAFGFGGFTARALNAQVGLPARVAAVELRVGQLERMIRPLLIGECLDRSPRERALMQMQPLCDALLEDQQQ